MSVRAGTHCLPRWNILTVLRHCLITVNTRQIFVKPVNVFAVLASLRMKWGEKEGRPTHMLSLRLACGWIWWHTATWLHPCTQFSSETSPVGFLFSSWSPCPPAFYHHQQCPPPCCRWLARLSPARGILDRSIKVPFLVAAKKKKAVNLV